MVRIASILLLLISPAFADQKPLRLDFGVYPSDRATVMYRKMIPVLEAIQDPIEQQLGVRVDIHLTIFADYAHGIRALANGDVDFVRFGPASYILAEEMNENVTLLAKELRKGLARFNGLIITRVDSGIDTVEDLRNRSFAFGDQNSTIGRFLAQSEMIDAGINSENLRSYDFLGRHDLVANAIISGSHDAGALKESTYKKLCDPKEIKIVKVFENVTKPWLARPGLPEPVQKAITNSLLAIEDAEVLKEIGCSGFTTAKPKDYDTVREGMARAASFNPKKDEQADSKNAKP
ncbi:MAG: PhnD/SsuA/transferrin family substrate-binding protein [Phycisphaerales bacterium]|jgi:phosphonate transport system substrate-binding protein|nr:PhnD/SsuA/transferrin family substrate-binding protein [Phycisphaerales bacterium]MDP6693505.1 PhnD/SsuA/transferrin family substrate-binding protein [Phycisphaerales bacterium]